MVTARTGGPAKGGGVLQQQVLGDVETDRAGGPVKGESFLQQQALAGVRRDTQGKAPGARSGVSHDKRVLLTKEDNDAVNDPDLFEDDTARHRHPGPISTHSDAEGFQGKDNRTERGENTLAVPSETFKVKAGETQLERIPVSRSDGERFQDKPRIFALPHGSVSSSSHMEKTPNDHLNPHAINTQYRGEPHEDDLSYSSSSTDKSSVSRSQFLPSTIPKDSGSNTADGKDSRVVRPSSISQTPHLSEIVHNNSSPHRLNSPLPEAAASAFSPARTKNNPSSSSSSGSSSSSAMWSVNRPRLDDNHPPASPSADQTMLDNPHRLMSSETSLTREAHGDASSSSADNSHNHGSFPSRVTADNSHNPGSFPSRITADNGHNPGSFGSAGTADVLAENRAETPAPHTIRNHPPNPPDHGNGQLASSSSGRSSVPGGGAWGVMGRQAEGVGSRLKKDGFLDHAYNVTASDLLPVDRQVPDTRPPGCPVEWPDVTSVGPVSIIICTHNEAPSVLRRTVYSVLRQTPSHLLSDVIVVDDNTTIGDPAVALEVIGHDVTQGRLHVLRTSGRQGLVRARLLGAKAARGRVLVFLDSHCECGPHWITPLLVALRHDKHKVVSPYIDVIRSESFAFARSPDNLQGDFNWRLEFGWRAIAADQLTSREGPHIPIRTPVISGGLFAVYRDFFFNIGAYDDHMDIWGGENMELSFRVWMCGGQLEIIPCSRVGHVFRSSVPYSFPGDRRHTVLRNLARAAHVWMDEFSPFFFAAVNMTSSREVGDVTSRVELRQRLGCRSFGWYLKTVAPHLHVPSPHTVQYGQFKNRGSLLCLTSSETEGLRHLRLLACHGSFNQTVELEASGKLHMGEACVGVTANKQLTLSPCPRSPARWTVRGEQVVLHQTDLCLTAVDNEFVHLHPCRHGNLFQLWEPSYTFTWPS